MHNEFCKLARKCGKVDETSEMILDGHDPTHPYAISILLPLCLHINQIDLKMISKCRQDNRLLCAFAHWNNRLLLFTNITLFTVNHDQLLHWTEVLWLGSLESPVMTHATLMLVSLMDNVEDRQHVTDNVPVFLMHENLSKGSIQTLPVLNIKFLGISVTLWVCLRLNLRNALAVSQSFEEFFTKSSSPHSERI